MSDGPSEAEIAAVADELDKWLAAAGAEFVTPSSSIAKRLLLVAARTAVEAPDASGRCTAAASERCIRVAGHNGLHKFAPSESEPVGVPEAADPEQK